MAKKRKKVGEGIAIVALILNVLVLPGLGSLIGGRAKEGVLQIALFLGSIILGVFLILTFIGAVIGVLLLFLGSILVWIWGIITSAEIIKEAYK